MAQVIATGMGGGDINAVARSASQEWVAVAVRPTISTCTDVYTTHPNDVIRVGFVVAGR